MVILSGLPFSVVDDGLTRKYSKLDKICRQTFVKYVQELTRKVEEKVSEALPNRFALVIDGWKDAPTSTLYLAVFASYPDRENPKKACNTLLVFSLLFHECDMSSDSHIEFTTSTLEIFNKDLSAVTLLFGDNVSMNIKLARVMGVPFWDVTVTD